jgi:tetratricopeptide (TPR) repeat protein
MSEANQFDPEYLRGAAFLAQGNLEAALVSWQQVQAAHPESAAAHTNVGALCNRLGRFDEALARCDQAVRLEPRLVEALNNRGAALRALGRLEEALTSFDTALHIKPEYADAHLGRAYTLLLAGRLAEGWAELEWRCRCPDFGQPSAPGPQPTWDGSPLRGRTLLLRAEQGLGDTLQFNRFAPLIRQQCGPGQIVVEAQPSLLPLLRSCPGVDQVIPQGGMRPLFHVHAFLLSLPGLLGTRLDSIPASVPYLAVEERLAAHWHTVLGSLPGFKIGIVWQGQSGNLMDRVRSVALAEFAPLAELEGVHLIGLQVGPGNEQLTGSLFPVTDLGARFDHVSFADVAAVVRNVDLVITVDTALAHLAGALAKPVWLALAFSPDWRWLLGREDTPWYPTMRLFRQSRPGDWAGVFVRMREVLRPLVREQAATTADKPL